MPHGTFSGLNNNDILEFSGLLFYDIDNGITDCEQTKRDLVAAGAVMAYRSIRHGVHALFYSQRKINSKKDFEIEHKRIWDYLSGLGFQLDRNAKGLSRKAVIGYDPSPEGPYVRDRKIDLIMSDEQYELPATLDGAVNSLDVVDDFFDDDMSDYIDHSGLVLKTPVNVPEGVDYIVLKIDNYVRVNIPKKIKDGQKHLIYKAAIIALIHLNPELSKERIYFWLKGKNSLLKMPMLDNKLRRLVATTFEWVHRCKIVPVGSVKWVHFSEASSLSTNEKKSIARSIWNHKKGSNTKDKVDSFRSDNDYKPTQEECAKALGLSVSTIRRHWK